MTKDQGSFWLEIAGVSVEFPTCLPNSNLCSSDHKGFFLLIKINLELTKKGGKKNFIFPGKLT